VIWQLISQHIHSHRSIRDFGPISLKQIIQTYIEKVRHGIANQDELIARPEP
jgi:hypothetical protein